MSQHSAVATTNTTTTNTTTATTTTTTAVTTNEESSSSAKPGSSSTTSLMGSLKKLKNKDAAAEVPLTDDFVLHIPPDKFKDKNINDSNAVVKRHCIDSSATSTATSSSLTSTWPVEKVNLECLLLSDTSLECGVPVHVQTLLKSYDNLQMTPAELLLLLIYIVALESGFVAAAQYKEVIRFLQDLSATSSFHAKNILYLSHHKPDFTSTENKTRFSLKLRTIIELEDEEIANDNLNSLLTAMLTGDFLIVTLTPNPTTDFKGFSLALSIPRYVLSIQPKNKPLYQRFRKLSELSYILRDEIFAPMRCQQLSLREYFIYPSLVGLPAELYDHIFKYINKNQLNILANVNKLLNNFVKCSKFK